MVVNQRHVEIIVEVKRPGTIVQTIATTLPSQTLDTLQPMAATPHPTETAAGTTIVPRPDPMIPDVPIGVMIITIKVIGAMMVVIIPPQPTIFLKF